MHFCLFFNKKCDALVFWCKILFFYFAPNSTRTAADTCSLVPVFHTTCVIYVGSTIWIDIVPHDLIIQRQFIEKLLRTLPKLSPQLDILNSGKFDYPGNNAKGGGEEYFSTQINSAQETFCVAWYWNLRFMIFK